MYVWEIGCNHTHLHDQIQAAVTLVKGVRKMSPNSIKNFADLQITIFMVLPHMVLCTYITCHHVLLLAMNRGNKCQLLHLSYTYQKVKYFYPISLNCKRSMDILSSINHRKLNNQMYSNLLLFLAANLNECACSFVIRYKFNLCSLSPVCIFQSLCIQNGFKILSREPIQLYQRITTICHRR